MFFFQQPIHALGNQRFRMFSGGIERKLGLNQSGLNFKSRGTALEFKKLIEFSGPSANLFAMKTLSKVFNLK